MIMKMVCQHPSLKWLQSDLTAENVVILQREERPNIMFVGVVDRQKSMYLSLDVVVRLAAFINDA
jgi:hypothetical protein